MGKVILVLSLAVFILGCEQKSSKKQKNLIKVENGILIENTTVITTNIDGKVKKFIGYILTNNEKIVYTGIDKPEVKGNFKILNGKGKFTIPGLIDSHVHLANMSGMTWNHQKKYPLLVQDYYAQLPKSFLYYGYTTLIDVNNYAPEVINNILNTQIRPDIYTCGKQVQIMNDFMMEMEGYSVETRLKLPFLYDKFNDGFRIPDSINLDSHLPSSIISNIVREHEGLCVKTLYEDESSGFPQSWELPSLELIRDLINEAQKEGIPVIMHAPSLNGQNFAYEAGIDIIAHSMWNWYDKPEQFMSLDFSQNHKDLLLKIAHGRVGYQPTFRAIHGEADLLKGQFSNNPELENIFPTSYLDWLKTDEGSWGKSKILQRGELVKSVNPYLYNIISSKFDSHEEMFAGIQKTMIVRMNKVAKLLADNNANLLFATDSGAMNMASHPPGYNGFLEMQHWLKAGISLEKIFLSATYNNSKAFRIDHKYGTITNGKIANLLILNKNPLQDISAYNEIHSVVVRGSEYSRIMFSAKEEEFIRK